MASREVLDRTYLKMAKQLATLSYARRAKVGCLIVKDTHIIAEGYNGTTRGRPNNCEIEIDGELVTKDEVVHSEANALMKLARSTQSSEGATMYCTLSPCINCAPLIVQAGITTVVYAEEYRDLSGIDFLRQCKVRIFKIPIDIEIKI